MIQQYSDITALVHDDFEQVNTVIRNNLHTDVPLINQLAHYVIASGGKRLRPLLTILSGRVLTPQNESNDEKIATTLPIAAAVIEYIHTATLIHDDVVDHSENRRGKATAHQVWGNEAAVLVGDFLYSRAFQLMQQLNSLAIQNLLADATNQIAEGEVLQLLNIGNIDTSEQDYFTIITAKTAVLFSAGCKIGALLGGADEKTASNLEQYGHHLGVAFQLMDDVLDYDGDSQQIGKNLGDDLAEGKPTLPIIHALSQTSGEEHAILNDAITHGDISNLQRIQDIVFQSDSIEYTRSAAQYHTSKALEALSTLSSAYDQSIKDALTHIARSSNNRKN